METVYVEICLKVTCSCTMTGMIKKILIHNITEQKHTLFTLKYSSIILIIIYSKF